MKASRLFPVAAAAVSTSRTTVVTGFVAKRGISSSFHRRNMSAEASNTNNGPPLIDVDCNLWHKDLSSFQNKEDSSPFTLLQEDAVEESNIVAMLSPSSTLQEARQGLSVLVASSSSSLPLNILTTVGVHPYHVNDEGVSLESDVESIRELVTQEYVCAVGECGLDASDGFPPLNDQVPWFQAQVQLANECNKPLFVHERLAFDETMNILESSDVPVIVHCFTGTRAECIAYIERGYSLSVSGFILKEDGNQVRECFVDGLIPLDRLMIETDAPYMGFQRCRTNYLDKNQQYAASLNSKKRKRLTNSIYPNVPSSLPIVLDEVVKLLNEGRSKRNQDLLERDEVARITTENAIRFFGFQGIELLC